MSYIDTSVLAAYYCPEPLSTKAERALRVDALPTVSQLAEVELFSAVGRKVREGGLSTADAERILTRFLGHVSTGGYRRVVLEERHFLAARDWMRRFDLRLRTLDALHLSVSADSHLTLLTADTHLAEAAESLGIDVMLLRP